LDEISANEDLQDEGFAASRQDLLPKSWNGAMSDAGFTARLENDVWILGVRIEAETPVLIQNPYHSLETLNLHADLFDFALSMARGDTWVETAKISGRSMSLAYVRDFYRVSGKNLSDGIKERRKKIEIDSHVLAGLKRSEQSAAALMRIADRIEKRLEEHTDPALLRSTERKSPTDSIH